VPAAKEEPENGEINRGCDERCDPDGHTKAESKVEDVAEAEQER
jgi:hypothetical protein